MPEFVESPGLPVGEESAESMSAPVDEERVGSDEAVASAATRQRLFDSRFSI